MKIILTLAALCLPLGQTFAEVNVSEITPRGGAVGSTVSIAGTGFDTSADYEVKVGTVLQNVHAVSGIGLTFQVAAGTAGGGVSISEAGGPFRETGFYFDVTRSVLLTVRLPKSIDAAAYEVVGAGGAPLGGVEEGPQTGHFPTSRATLAGIVAGDDDPALFVIVPPGGAAVEVSPMSHAVATIFMMPGLVPRGAAADVPGLLADIAEIPEVVALAAYVEAACVPGHDFMDTTAYADRVEAALSGYLSSLPDPEPPAAPGPLASEDDAEQPVLVRNLITPSLVDPASLSVSVDPPGGQHPDHYLLKVEHAALVVELDFSIEITRVDPNSFPAGRQTVRSADRNTNYTYLDDSPLLNGYKTASLFASTIDLVEFFTTNGPDAFPGLQASFNEFVGLTPELEELASPNNFLIPKDFAGVLAVHS